ncbi:MAG: hypothetical protein JW715_04305 [Sedimentisphaerales bacterium]|nr:hypothetical protein [Sedimentisphaerales bacterium]
MKKYIVLSAVVFLLTVFARAQEMDLSGQWSFQMDPNDNGVSGQWFGKSLARPIKLPGSLQEQGYGEKPSAKTRWTTGIGTQLLSDPRFTEYIQSEDFKCPFWLTPERYYVGPAWYQRQIDIASDWANKRIILYLERPHWQTTVWIDDKKAGVRETLGSAHEYDLTDFCTPGKKHQLTIRVDNSVVVPVGMDAHSISDQTQSNWNGIAGEVKLYTTAKVWFDDVQVFPDVDKKQIKVVIDLGNNTKKAGSGQITVKAVSDNSPAKHTTQPQTVPASWTEKSGKVSFVHSMGQDCLRWDEYSPALYELELKLTGENLEAGRVVTFGMRELGIRDKQFTINGRKIFIRGTLECCIFPEHGYPPTDVAEWRRIIGIAKAHGLNHFRFHSWCPPEAAFAAADREGFYLQAEGSCWAAFGDGGALDEWIYKEIDGMIRAYGNHPSFCFFSPSNEPSGRNREQFLGKLLENLKTKDNRRFYVAGAGWPQIKENQYSIEHAVRLQRWPTLKFDQPPQTFDDYRSHVETRPVPVIGHEIGQWCAYPDISEESQYTGVLKAKNMAIFRDKLKKAGMENLAHDFLMASGKFQSLLYKQEIEAALRSPGFAGFQLLDLHDFPGQGTAPVGVLNALWQSKGYITPEQYRRFCNDIVPLARMKKRIFTNDESFAVIVDVANYSSRDLTNVPIQINMCKSTGRSIGTYEFAVNNIPAGGLTRAGGEINFDLSSIKQASKLNFEVRLKGTEYANDWDIWVYPAKLEQSEPENVFVTQDSQEAMERLRQGDRVLLILEKSQAGGNTLGTFRPIFWNLITFPRNRVHTLGILCDPEHEAFKNFPTDFHSNWQWQNLLDNSKPVIMDSLPEKLVPIIQPIDDWNNARKLGLLFEAQLEKGKLMLCAIDIQNELSSRPEARQLRCSILSYMSSEKFDPQIRLSSDDIAGLLR